MDLFEDGRSIIATLRKNNLGRLKQITIPTEGRSNDGTIICQVSHYDIDEIISYFTKKIERSQNKSHIKYWKILVNKFKGISDG